MRLLLHGAINGSNFGDCLFAKMFYDKIYKECINAEVFFFDKGPFGISDHLRKYIDYKNCVSLNKYKSMDALIYISGGYFGESYRSLFQSLIRIIRYYLIGLYFVYKRKPIYIIGVEVGPFHSKLVERIATKLLKYSKMVIVRNKASDDWCKEHGISCLLTADTALSLEAKNFDYIESHINETGKKHIFLHINVEERFEEPYLSNTIIPLMEYINLHNEYDLVYGCDGIPHFINHGKLLETCKAYKVSVQYCDYNNPSVLCDIINHCDVIVTKKLHVGIIAAVFGKSVISTPSHEYKVKRFYESIGYPERCILYKEIDNNTIKNLLEKYARIGIHIPSEITELSKKNIESLIVSLNSKD